MLYAAVRHIYPGITDADFRVQNDGAGDYIAGWTYAEPEPSQAQIDAAISEVEAVQAAVAYVPARKADYYDRTAALTGWNGAYAENIAFWIDEIMGWAQQEIDAGRLLSTPGMDALLQIRTAVKAAHPKP